MPGFSTLALGGTIISPIRLNYDLSISSSTTVALAYSTASITDIVGLQVVIYNNSSSSITLTAGTQFDNHESYPGYCAAANTLLIPARQTVTLITKTIGQDYTISAISGMLNIDKGAAGNLIYQTAANRTGFLAAGTQDYVLISGGPGQPPVWNLLSTGNLAGGVAGSLLYQSAPSATAKSAAGTAFGGSGGGMAGMTSSTTGGWVQTTLSQGLNQSTFSGGTLTFQAARAYTFTTQAINAGTSGNLYTFLTANSIPQIDGNVYTIYNNSSSSYALSIQNIQNPNSWSSSLLTSLSPGANVVTIYPNESVTFQQFNSTYLSVVSATQCLQLAASFAFQQPPNNAGQGVINLTTNFDPEGWLSSNWQVKPKKPGNYLVYAQYSNANAQSSSLSFLVQKNNTTPTILQAIQWPYISSSQFTNTGAVVVYLNGTTDYVNLFRSTTFSSSYWIGGTSNNLSVIYLN